MSIYSSFSASETRRSSANEKTRPKKAMITSSSVFECILRGADTAQDEQAFVDALVTLELEPAEALRALRFTQVSWARSILERLPITLSPEFVFFDASGIVQERGRLENE